MHDFLGFVRVLYCRIFKLLYVSLMSPMLCLYDIRINEPIVVSMILRKESGKIQRNKRSEGLTEHELEAVLLRVWIPV